MKLERSAPVGVVQFAKLRTSEECGGYRRQGVYGWCFVGRAGDQRLSHDVRAEVKRACSVDAHNLPYDVDTTGRDPVAVLEVYRAGHGLVEQRGFSWDEINGRKRLKLLPPPPAKTRREK